MNQADPSVITRLLTVTVPKITTGASKLRSPDPTPADICVTPLVAPVSVLAILANVGVPPAAAEVSLAIALIVRTPLEAFGAIGFDIEHDANKVPAGVASGVEGSAPSHT